jgi:hypothetical protein
MKDIGVIIGSTVSNGKGGLLGVAGWFSLGLARISTL